MHVARRGGKATHSVAAILGDAVFRIDDFRLAFFLGEALDVTIRVLEQNLGTSLQGGESGLFLGAFLLALRRRQLGGLVRLGLLCLWRR